MARGKTRELTPGATLYHPDGEPHALRALGDALLRVTVVLRRP